MHTVAVAMCSGTKGIQEGGGRGGGGGGGLYMAHLQLRVGSDAERRGS